jgi:excisionase family DNA binding protein
MARGRSARSKAAEATLPGFTVTVQPLVSIPVGAKILDVSVWTLRQWLSPRRLAYVKVGRLTKLKVSDIQDFIDSHRQEAIRLDRERA